MIHLHASAARIDRTPSDDLPSQGLWALYDGGPMVMHIPQLADDAVDVVIDLAGLTLRGERIWALEEHERTQRVGYWDEIAISQQIQARLHLRQGDHGGDWLESRALQIAADIEQGMPIEASVGVDFEPADVDWHNPGEIVNVNGRLLHQAGPRKLAVVRRGLLSEASIVGFGASVATGKIAASEPLSPSVTPIPTSTERTPTMKDRLTALCARLGDTHRATIAIALAEEHSDDEIAEQIAQTEKEAIQQQLEELQAQVAALTAERDELAAKLATAEAAAPVAAPAGVAAAAAAAPVATTIPRSQLRTLTASQQRDVATGKLQLVDG